MKGCGRVNIDSAGGAIVGIVAPNVIVNGQPIVLIGAAVTPHSVGVHLSSVMVEGGGSVFVNGIPVCRTGDAASCGDTLTSGSNNVFIGD